MIDLPPALRRRQRLFLLLALIFPIFLLGLMALQMVGWNQVAINPNFLFLLSIFLLESSIVFVLPALTRFWFTRRYYLSVASAEPMPDELFVAGCSNLAGVPVLSELAIDLRNTFEEKLMLPRGTLRPETNLQKFDMWAYFLYASAISEKFHLGVGDFKKSKQNVRILARFIRATEEILRSRQYVREEPGELVSKVQVKAIAAEELPTSIEEPLVLRETGKLFRRWVFTKLILVPVGLVLGYLCSMFVGIVGTVIGVLCFGFILFVTLVLSAFPTITIDPRTRRVTIVREVFGIVPISRKEKGFDEITLVRVYDHRAAAESKQIVQQVYLIPVGEEDGWLLGDNASRQMSPKCDVEVARKISALMQVPLEIVQYAPPPPRWLRRFYGAVKENSNDKKQKD